MHEQSVYGKRPQDGVNVDDNEALDVRKAIQNKLLNLARTFFEGPSAEEQALGVLILSASDCLFESRHAVTQNKPACAEMVEIPSGWRGRIEKRIELLKTFWASSVRHFWRKKVTIQIDVAFVESPQPSHSIGIEHMHHDDRCILRRRDSLL